MSVLRTLAVVLGVQLAIAGGALGVALYEHTTQRVECGKPALIATVVGYNLWKVRECGPGGSPVYMMTPPVVGEPSGHADREHAI
jgi:hypothetical protein